MLFLALTILGSSAIAIAMRLSEGRVAGKMSMLAVNYLTCALLSLGASGLPPFHADGIGLTAALGVVSGALYLAALGLSQYNIARNGVVLSSVFSQIGNLLVPLALSVACFGERPGPAQAVGAALAVLSIVAVNSGSGRGVASSKLLLPALLLAEGLSSAMSKVFEEVGSPALGGSFLAFTFASAFLFSAALAARRHERPGWPEICFGAMVGVPNFLASRFLLRALADIPAIVVYPTRGVMSIVITSLAGIALFHERLKPRQWLAIGVILLAVALLNIHP